MCGLELMALGSREKRLYLLSHRVVLFLNCAFANFTCPLQPPTPSPKKIIMNEGLTDRWVLIPLPVLASP